MKEKLIAWQERIRATTEFKVFKELVFWGAVIVLWTLVGDMMSAYNDVIVYAGGLVGAALVTISALRIYNYFQTVKNKTKNENNNIS